MYLTENPVLQRELLSNLRMGRAFLLLFAYVALLGGVVYLAWPAEQTLDMTRNPEASRRLVNLFFLGQYILASLMAPSFAAGAITGEKERKSFEMLLACPMRPSAIVFGKLVASLTHLGILVVCSLPIVMLCLPLGGVSPLEVGAAYMAMLMSIVLSGMISLWCSSYFQRTSAALVVSYLFVLPLAMFGVFLWRAMELSGDFRFYFMILFVPIFCLAICVVLWAQVSRSLLYPKDLGSEGKEVVDLEREAEEAVGLYIKRDEFPDRLFAPPKRTDFIDDGVNPVYDKEMRSEIFSQGTLMLRLVIQISMGLSIPIFAICLFVRPQLAPWYILYVLLFNMLVGPVFSAGSVTQERERQTLDLVLNTLITPWQMLWGKLFSGLRVSTVLTSFLMWPVVLACLMPVGFWRSFGTMLGYFLIVALSCLITAISALFCSTIFRKTSTSLMVSYLWILTMYMAPPAAIFFAKTFFRGAPVVSATEGLGAISPVIAVFALPLDVGLSNDTSATANGLPVSLFFGFLIFTAVYVATLMAMLMWLFNRRWRVSE